MNENFLNGRVVLHSGDCMEVLASLPENSVHAIVCDPPYHLTSIVKRFGGANAAPAKGNAAYMRASKGFMSRVWDGGDIAFQPELWSRAMRVLRPGGHVAAFAATRNYHRMACAIEDAGFEVRDSILDMFDSSKDAMAFLDSLNAEQISAFAKILDDKTFSGLLAWSFGSGFPKSKNVGGGWGSALKPAFEPICLARKPLSEPTIALNFARWGTGAINIDGCRVGTEDMSAQWDRDWNNNADEFGKRYDQSGRQRGKTVPPGRWPANIIHDGSEEVVAAFPDAPGQQYSTGPQYDRKAEVYGKFAGVTAHEPRNDAGSAARFFYQVAKDDRCDLCDANIATSRLPTENTRTASSARRDAVASQRHESADKDRQLSGPAGSAETRSLQCHPPEASIAASLAQTPPPQKIVQNVSNAANLCGSCATAIAQEIVAASRSEPLGLSVSKCSIGDSKKTILLRCLASYVESRENTDTILTTTNLRELFGCVFHAIGESIRSAKVGSEASTKPAPKRLWYSSKADADDRLGSKHPTVKPVDLMQWLCRLVTPPGGTVLDPFAGTGTTGEAAFREGFKAVLIEREEEYQADIRRRMGLVLSGPDERSRESIKARTAGQPIDHGPLFGGLDTPPPRLGKYQGHKSKFYVGPPAEQSDRQD